MSRDFFSQFLLANFQKLTETLTMVSELRNVDRLLALQTLVEMAALVKKNFLNITTWKMTLTLEYSMVQTHLRTDGSASVQPVTLDRHVRDLFVKITLAIMAELALSFLAAVIFVCALLENMATYVNTVRFYRILLNDVIFSSKS